MVGKVLSPAQEKECDRIAFNNGLKGAALGLGLGLVATVMTFRRSPEFRALSRPFQSIMAVSGASAGYLFAADRASSAYENRVLGYTDEEMLTSLNRRQNPNAAPLSTTDHVLHYLNDNRWTVIGVSWAVSMVGALGLSFSNRFLTTQQKIVQARMYAQAVTIAVLMASAGISVYVGDDDKKNRKEQPDAQLRAVLDLPNNPAYYEPKAVKHEELKQKSS
ncbi:hypothetical protein J3Q64DRAFT_1711262 [Phycomyces blakesleeanus]|uniref:HIG1 domain-containing protein n=2 Tax=Phycomyces blakesleeanus TaxID=4837 RepID=A0A162NE08_PHYB8|nr:hypothetical protein PHYBLDRAFT_188647 [Phycomyces blakesleeanus NRRL 1555(-)]OAD68684.1 hypothetical protein PHYBLDRAFT_188647 [Phycomyces blakesleeanus NRRL 1555(-)]|eukprot:XP_018286724.1 hypothetical protein PHYBLDRAFT_188647 [Phycomyces blakesleeanus NRRL 1555(-)]